MTIPSIKPSSSPSPLSSCCARGGIPLQLKLLLLLAAIPTRLLIHGAEVFEPVANLDLRLFQGIWFQYYASRSVSLSFDQCFCGNCFSAQYEFPDADANKTGTFLEATHIVRPLAKLDDDSVPFWSLMFDQTRKGYISQSPQGDGRLTIDLPTFSSFFSFPRRPDLNNNQYQAPGNYWVIAVGPIRNFKYSWAMVTNGEDGFNLQVLVRDVDNFERRFLNSVKLNVLKWGFTKFWNRPYRTGQIDCNYEFFPYNQTWGLIRDDDDD